jgi:phospho-N-acetylmuramoyl-pentapeptide-transferase
MLYYIIGFWATELERAGLASLVDLCRSIMFRTAAASVTAFLLCVWFGPRVIRWLGSRWREPIGGDSSRLVELHQGKRNTPTMGGTFVLGSLVASTLIWGNPLNVFVAMGVLLALGLATLGAIDDLTKLAGKRRGLAEREKLLGQLAVGMVVGFSLFWSVRTTAHGTSLAVPIWAAYVPLGWLFVPWATLVIAGSSNGVNFADGLDGLASGCWVFAGLAVGVLDYIGGHAGLAAHLSVPYVPGCGELTVLVGAAVGATLGFLWFNCYPAEVFLGDTGSLGLGGLLGFAALVPRQELLLAIAGGVFVAETVSVVLQRYYFKATGRRILLCAPLHHHFQFLGWPESKIVVRFWIAAALLSILSVATLKLR